MCLGGDWEVKARYMGGKWEVHAWYKPPQYDLEAEGCVKRET
jgi:hypothetical protein